MADFKTYALHELSELHVRMEHIKQQIAPLQRELEKLQTKSDALSAYLEADEESNDTQNLIAEHIVDRRNPVELIENILRRAARPLHYREILLRLKTEENFDMPGKDPAANLTARLSINPQFVRVGKGTYVLQEGVPATSETATENDIEVRQTIDSSQRSSTIELHEATGEVARVHNAIEAKSLFSTTIPRTW